MSTKLNVLSELEKSGENYLSGERLAEKLGVSRNAIWKAVNALREDGIMIEAAQNSGYRLIQEYSTVYQLRVEKYLSTQKLGRNLICLKTVDSTNTYAKQLAHNGCIHGTTVVSEIQTSGRGRLGRTFESPKSTGLYMSVIIKNQLKAETAQLITSCTAVAVAEAIDKVCGTSSQIKWVNDIFINNKKICGILTEASMSFETGTLDYAVIGIGVNVYSIKDKFSEELNKTASSIEDETGIRIDRSKLCAEILNSLEKNLANLENRNFIDEYKKRSCITGHDVMVIKGNTERKAYAFDIDESANLKVRYEDGTEEALNSGEARIIR